MGFFQGSPLPNVTTTVTKNLTAPDYYTDYLNDLSQAGQTALQKTAAEGIAGYDPLQTQGYNQIADASGAYKTGLGAAAATAGKPAAGIQQSRIDALMNPYQSQVIDEMARRSQQNLQRNLLPGIKSAFVGSGALGGQRYAGALGQSLADVQADLTGQQAGVLASGYQNAMKAALDELQLQNQAAQTQANIAEKEQTLGLAGADALTKAGAERQKFEQAKLDYPLTTATNVSQLLRNFQVPISATETTVAPGQQGQFGLSGFQNLAGILSLIGGAGGAAGANAGAQRVFDWISRTLGSGGGGTTGGGTTGGGTTGGGTTGGGTTGGGFTFIDPIPQPQYDSEGNQIGTLYYFG